MATAVFQCLPDHALAVVVAMALGEGSEDGIGIPRADGSA